MPSSTLNDALLPPRSRLFYIGPMKTGTAIQAAASNQRQILLDHGVRYPGMKLNHRSALGALLGWATMTGRRTGQLGPDRLDMDEGGIPIWASGMAARLKLRLIPAGESWLAMSSSVTLRGRLSADYRRAWTRPDP